MHFSFFPSISPDAPLFVYIHGGYWQDLSRDISAYCVRPLARAGTRVAILGYTLAPHGKISINLSKLFTHTGFLLT